MDEFTKYLVVGPLSVDNLNATHPDIIAGYPMPTAVAGFGYKLSLDIERIAAGEYKSLGTAVVVHSHSELGGHSKNPVEDSKKGAASIIDEFRARAELSFVLALEGLDDGGDLIDLQAIGDKLELQSPEWFFGGGKVFPNGLGTRKLVIATDADGLEAALSKVPAGYVLFDRHDLLEKGKSEGRDTLDALLDLVEVTKVVDGDGKDLKTTYTRKQEGWIVPLSVGFQAIELPKVRAKSRINDGVTPHVFAETIYSAGEYKSLRTRIALKGSEALNGAFWSHRADRDTGTFFVSATQTA